MYPRVRDQHIAVFGESGSGKTVLVSAFYGASQESSFLRASLFNVVADDVGLGNRLQKNYVGMRDRAIPPETTRFSATPYSFSVKMKNGDNEAARRRPFDVLRLVWHDYPGQWFEEEPSSAEEAARRVDTFRSLLRSDVAVLLVDGQKLLDNAGEEERYLKSLLWNVRNGLLRLKDDLLEDGEPLVEFPRIWMLALSKADLLPDLDVYKFRDLIIGMTNEDIAQLHEVIKGFVLTPEALSVGEDFMLLSSAKFVPGRIEVTERVGVDLILPVAAMLPLERRVQWSERMEIPRRVLEHLADGAETLAAALIAGQAGRIDRLLGRLPRVGPLIRRGGIPALLLAAKLAESQLRQINAEAVAKRDFLAATLTQFRLDLVRGEKDNLLIKSRR
jgi:hypothetical protein